MLKSDPVACVDDHAVTEGAFREPVVGEHAEKLRMKKVSLLLVAGAGEYRHAEQVIGAVSVADSEDGGLGRVA